MTSPLTEAHHTDSPADFLVGVIAFERSFTAIHIVLSNAGTSDFETFKAEFRNRNSAVRKIAHGEIMKLFGGGCGQAEMKGALDGFAMEAKERYAFRTAEAEALFAQGRVVTMESQLDITSSFGMKP
jgi:hypothetical protein